MDTEYKTLVIKEVTDTGRIEAVISTFGRDRDGDVMTREAFHGSQGKAIPMVWSHNWDQPIGKGVVSVGASGAVFSGEFNLATSAGREAYEAVKFAGELQEYSIGFRIKDAERGYEEADGKRIPTRFIKDLELFEASPVLVGAAYNTGTLAIKEAKSEEDIHEQIKALKDAHDAGCELGDACPFFVPEPVVEQRSINRSEREQALAEITAVLGYTPLIAEGA